MPLQHIGSHILVIRGQRVMLDIDLADLYGVPTKRLNEQVKRNLNRFPEDFMFRLTRAEVESLNRSQIATGSQKHRDPRFPPFAFTEHGAIQAANVLNSPSAVEMGLYVVRAFVQLREFLATNKDLAAKFNELEHKLSTHDQAITGLINNIRQLMAPPPDPEKRPIGFVIPQEKKAATKGQTAGVKRLIAKNRPQGVQFSVLDTPRLHPL